MAALEIELRNGEASGSSDCLVHRLNRAKHGNILSSSKHGNMSEDSTEQVIVFRILDGSLYCTQWHLPCESCDAGVVLRPGAIVAACEIHY